MNFLQICARMASKAGIAGVTPASSQNQVGEALRVVNWCKDAYIDIQERRDDWSFMRKDFTFTCTIGNATYPASTVTDLANWRKEDVRCYLSDTNDEQWLAYRDWETFRATRLMGSQRTVTGRPQDYTVKPDRSMVLWPIPDQAYAIDGEYYRTSVPFFGDSDTPLFPRFHMAIVYQALMYYGAYSAEPSVYADAQKEFERLIDKLEYNETTLLTVGGALA